LHEEELGSIFEGLEATLTDNRVGIVASKIGKFIQVVG
jgi:hypothetical protein